MTPASTQSNPGYTIEISLEELKALLRQRLAAMGIVTATPKLEPPREQEQPIIKGTGREVPNQTGEDDKEGKETTETRIYSLPGLKECDDGHDFSIPLGFKSSFSEGAASVVLQCSKCLRIKQENL